MEFEWDDAKNAGNIAKHGIAFDDAKRIFEGPVFSWTDDRIDYGELRTISIGTIDSVAVVVVVHTDRMGRTRLISARRASQRERARYEASL
jgi:uncharacterized DUF497 family protein